MNKVPAATSVAALLRSTSRASRAVVSSRHGGSSRLPLTSLPLPSSSLYSTFLSPSLSLAPSHARAYTTGTDPAARRAAVLEVVKSQALGHKDAFYVVDLAEIQNKFHVWQAQLPRVRPFYAVKCNDDPKIVETLAALGAGFDCASKGEMSMALKLGVKPEDMIFAHPAKQVSHLHYALKKGVQRMTFDNEDELRKIAREHPTAEVVLRILTDDSHSVCRLGLKFGAPLSSVHCLLSVAKELGVKVVGVSYHVGSGNGNAASFGDAVRDARKAFDIAKEVGFDLKLLDIGGGFPGSELGSQPGSDRLAGKSDDDSNPYSKHPSFSKIATVVRDALDTHFPEGSGVNIIAEPGRYFVKSSHVLAVNVVGKRKTVDEATGGTRVNYYVNDGLYGSFNCVMYDHVTCSPSLVLSDSASDLSLSAARAAVADDAIIRMDAEGNQIVSDALGMDIAGDLRESMAPEELLEEASLQLRKQMVMGSSDAETDMTMHAGVILAAAAHSFNATARDASSRRMTARSGGASAVAQRALNYSNLAAKSAARELPTTLWGPTCDSIDKISDTLTMPELSVGDWLVFENMGAYTIAGSCRFNGFPLSTKVYMHPGGRLEVQSEEVTE